MVFRIKITGLRLPFECFDAKKQRFIQKLSDLSNSKSLRLVVVKFERMSEKSN